ncbi:MAG: hypothetical protein BWK72_03635 [Rhodoferax ferrireducens]|uniref:Uncharacterized protein n=1 Tax=Rhodoferax ferrireducens TaxID=192843 RepID=A0A1W9KWU7_9BURK|nr:MAG: hypothetical protein BWK72_03635 [Rhodoferax ferrireducens]
MSAKKLSTVTCHVISSYGNTANNVIHAYRAGGERVVKLLDKRWNGAMRQSRSQLAGGVAKNATLVQQAMHKYSLKGLTLTSGGAQSVVKQVVKMADAGVTTLSAGASRIEDKTGAHVFSTMAHAVLPGALVLDNLASQIEQKSADLASRIAGDNVVVKVAKRATAATRKPRMTPRKAPTATAAA